MSDEPMTIEEAREQFTVTKVHCPTLHEMSPDFQLLNMKCPFDKDGHCRACEHFAGVYSEDGVFAAYGAYEGFCDHPKEENHG